MENSSAVTYLKKKTNAVYNKRNPRQILFIKILLKSIEKDKNLIAEIEKIEN